MKKINIFKSLLVVLVFSLIIFIFGCKTPTPETPKYDVAYINEKLDATGFTSYFYQKTIKSGEIILLEENTNVSLKDGKYLVKTEILKLNTIDNQTKYDVQENEEEVEIAEDPIKLSLKESDFNNVEVSENSLTGTVKDDANILGFSVKNLNLKINLNNSKVSNIELSYTDVETNLIVKVIVKYNY